MVLATRLALRFRGRLATRLVTNFSSDVTYAGSPSAPCVPWRHTLLLYQVADDGSRTRCVHAERGCNSY